MGPATVFAWLSGLAAVSAFGDPFGRQAIIPFSTKYPDQIIPDQSVCLPRIFCNKFTRSTYDTSLAWTDLLDAEGGIGSYQADQEGLSGPVDLPPQADLQDDFDNQLSSDLEAVVAEDENLLIEQARAECTKDKDEYCSYSEDKKYLGSKHTMCKFCGLGDKCPYYLDPAKNDLTGRRIVTTEMKELIVQLHNEVRSKIARGACGQPRAGCMGPVVWDDELARVAQKWADQCADVDYKDDYKRQDPALFHDPHPNRKVDDFSDWRGVGQNVARDISKGVAGAFNATRLVGHWFRQIRLFDPEGVKSFGSGDQCSLGVGYYTQLVWQNTTHVGCGWTQFQYRGFPGYFENFLVCNYGPAANIWKDPVYDIADSPCDCPCVDCDKETGMCPFNARYGSWSSWGSWGTCSRSCGGGSQERRRACTAPSKDGKDREPCPLCKGDGSELQKCNIKKCPEWSVWAPWSRCSVSCGTGERKRTRVCGNGKDDKGACPGEADEYLECDAGPCPAWTQWTAWTSCSLTCGGGTRNRIRQCATARSSECVGPAKEEEECNTNACPTWTEWGPWTDCSASCGGGKKTKVRECIKSRYGGEGDCIGEDSATESCNGNPCPDWTSWTKWTPCTASCGGGTKYRQRDCVVPDAIRLASRTPVCVGNATERVECNTEVCPVWTEWTDWSDCSASCGGGTQTRGRECVLPTRDLDGCSGNKQESRVCNTQECPIWTEWTDWTDCTVTCGGGTRYKLRECVLPSDLRNLGCKGDNKVTEKCNTAPCPQLTPWSSWSECSRSCGGGSRVRTRDCVYPRSAITDSAEEDPKNDCGEVLTETEECNTEVCPEYTEWSDWTKCTKSCGGGTRRKVRECVLPRGLTGCNGPAELEEPCNPAPCPVWTPWTDWTPCTATCGGGKQRRDRECVVPSLRAGQLAPECFPGEPVEERDCNSNTCPDWTDWTEWSECSATCGGGIKRKVRECVVSSETRYAANGVETVGSGPCVGSNEAVEECNTEECPAWTEWTEWTECSASCGAGGLKSRVRQCLQAGEESGLCQGDSEEQEACNEDVQCPAWTDWSDWTECSASCGGGTRRRTRDCVRRDAGGCGDDGLAEETEPCNTQGCPGWSQWTEWSNCSQPCGGGIRERERECLVNGERCICEEDKLCVGNFKEGETCNEDPCPEWSSWSSWSFCSVSCGEGTQSRQRWCRGKGSCEGDAEETKPCKERSCVTWTEWGSWSACSVTCGTGSRERLRKCGTSIRYLDTCPGDEKEAEICYAGPCSKWGQWTPWSQCSASCGEATRRRERVCTTESVGGRVGGGGLPACSGDKEQVESCNVPSCSGWSEWGEWSACSSTCGPGSRRRERVCSTSPLQRLGLLLSPCSGPSQESGRCDNGACPTTTTTQVSIVNCDDKSSTSSGFYGFAGRPATNIADCSWDYFGCTKRFGTYPDNRDCCMMRYKQCCMLVMGMPPATTTKPPAAPGGYGPADEEEIDIDLDIDIGTLEKPIDDIDLGNGTGVTRPEDSNGRLEVSPVLAEIEDDDANIISNSIDNNIDPSYPFPLVSRCGPDKPSLSRDPTDCTKYFACQRVGPKEWKAQPMSCPEGTGFDPNLASCNFVRNVRACSNSFGRRARILTGFEDLPSKKAFAKKTAKEATEPTSITRSVVELIEEDYDTLEELRRQIAAAGLNHNIVY